LFGLNANADISYYSAAAKALWAGLIDLQPRSAGGGGGGGAAAGSGDGSGGGGGGGGREELVAGVARDILARLPAQFDVPAIRKAISVPSPTQVGGGEGRGRPLRCLGPRRGVPASWPGWQPAGRERGCGCPRPPPRAAFSPSDE
jgi:hypothetical protein